MTNGKRWGSVAAVALAIAGCHNNSTPNYTSTLNIAFSPMYSGYDGVHTYQIPATINNTSGSVTWSASDPSMVQLTPDANGIDVMITTKKAGKVTIQAVSADMTAIGKSLLTIEQFTPDQWTAGQTRYTSGPTFTLGQAARGMATGDAQCMGCHGSSPGDSAIEHTPEQTGGYTDDELTNIYIKGILPAQDQSNSLFVTPQFFMGFHHWTVPDMNAQVGLIAYLRSLAPKAQGSLDFGGNGRGDGGMRGPRDMGGGGSGGGGGGGGSGGGGGGTAMDMM